MGPFRNNGPVDINIFLLPGEKHMGGDYHKIIATPIMDLENQGIKP